MVLPNYFKGHSLNTPRMVLRFWERLESMVQKEKQREFYLQWETRWRKRRKNTITSLISGKEVREPGAPHRWEFAEFTCWGDKGTTGSKIISLFHRFLECKLTFNMLRQPLISTSLDQRSGLVTTMVTLNWVRGLERTVWWKDIISVWAQSGPDEMRGNRKMLLAMGNLPFWAQWLVVSPCLPYILVPRTYKRRS